MQFRKAQRAELARNWGPSSWFYVSASPQIRSLIGRAYGIEICDPKHRSKAQEDLTYAMTVFTEAVRCEKAQACHALLTGSIQHLEMAITRRLGSCKPRITLQAHWLDAFKEVVS